MFFDYYDDILKRDFPSIIGLVEDLKNNIFNSYQNLFAEIMKSIGDLDSLLLSSLIEGNLKKYLSSYYLILLYFSNKNLDNLEIENGDRKHRFFDDICSIIPQLPEVKYLQSLNQNKRNNLVKLLTQNPVQITFDKILEVRNRNVELNLVSFEDEIEYLNDDIFSEINGLRISYLSQEIENRLIVNNNLRFLTLESIGLTYVPDFISSMNQLTVLSLKKNKLEHLNNYFHILNELDSLIGLDLSHNKIHDLHPIVANLKDLTYLNISHNPLKPLIDFKFVNNFETIEIGPLSSEEYNYLRSNFQMNTLTNFAPKINHFQSEKILPDMSLKRQIIERASQKTFVINKPNID